MNLDESPESLIQAVREQCTSFFTTQEKINFVSSVQNDLEKDYKGLTPQQKYVEYRTYEKIKKGLEDFKLELVKDQCYINQTSSEPNDPMLHTNNNRRSKGLASKLKGFCCCL